LEGAVGSRLAGRYRLFRYEIRRWHDGVIPDIGEAVSSPVRVTQDLVQASLVLDLVESVPALVWDGTRATRATCGIRTRWSHGCSLALASILAGYGRRPVVARRGGARALRSRAAMPPGTHMRRRPGDTIAAQASDPVRPEKRRVVTAASSSGTKREELAWWRAPPEKRPGAVAARS
jgi:hypothetical protein